MNPQMGTGEPSQPAYPTDLYPGCPCYTCDSPTWDARYYPPFAQRMSVCPRCGSKRCKGAISHVNPCGADETSAGVFPYV